MAKIQSVWAIDIGQAALKALKLTPGDEPDQVLAEAFDYVEYPKILSQPDADPEELVREALTTFIERNDVKGSKVAISVSGQAGLVKFVKLPPVEKSRIPDVVKFEARQQIPFALEEVIWDYQKIGGEDGEEEEDFAMVEVGLFAMKRDQINRAILPLKAAGVEVDFVQMAPIALYNYIAFDNPPPKEEGASEPSSYVLLDIGADNTDLIITDGTRIWQRNVPIGGNHFTRALTKELKQTFAKAEHLKRNATKSANPREVFTAMRGIFSDFASEVNRSIGFYSSVNRGAKINKIIGLGNGFKLPGLMKFLQQNVNHEVVKLENFEKLVGDEVVNAPQFQDNLASFAVAYGLGVQGLGDARMRTNLLPPEVEQVRMIRRKKPWALAASTLLLVGLSAMFASAWGALQKTRPLEAPAKDAKQVADEGNKFQSDFDAAKSEFTKIKSGGEMLVADSPDSDSWPALIQTTLGTLPNPAVELAAADPDFDPADPVNQPILGMLRVHVDKLVPVYRDDLAAGWFDTIENNWKETMHPLDRETPPSGEGWVIQLVGHHYNPSKNTKNLSESQKTVAEGPLRYLRDSVLPRFWTPAMRLFGIHHAGLTWYHADPKWTTASGAGSAPPPPLREKASPKSTGEGGTDTSAAMKSKMGGMGAMGMGGMGGSGGMSGMMQSKMGGMGGYGAMGGGMNMGGQSPRNAEKDMTYLTRTDFIIEFAWQPPKRTDLPKTEEELTSRLEEQRKKLTEAEAKTKGSLHASEIDEAALAQLSEQASIKAVETAIQKIEAENKSNGGETTAPAAPDAAAPAPAETTTP